MTAKRLKRPLKLIALLSFLVCSKSFAENSYPSQWWEPIARSEAASWEILPQDAKSGEVVLSKRTELGILSNFAPTPFVFQGKRYASVEGFWQMMKYPDNSLDSRSRFVGTVWKYSRNQVSQMASFEAKKAGDLASENMKLMRINWVTFEGRIIQYKDSRQGEHYELIKAAMKAKLEQNPRVKEVLLSTGDLVLRPDHVQAEGVSPAWKYFDIWMEIRKEIQMALNLQRQ